MVVAEDSVSPAVQVQEREAGLVALFSSSSTVVCPNEATHGKPHLRNWTEVAPVVSSPQLK